MSFVQELLKPGGGIALIPYIRATIFVLLLMVMWAKVNHVTLWIMGACPMSHCCGRVGFVCAGHSALGSAWLRTSMFKWRDATVYLMGLRYGHAWPNTVIAYAQDATSVWSITRDVTDRSTFIDCRSFCFWSGRLTFELFSFQIHTKIINS